MTMTRQDTGESARIRQDPFWAVATFAAGCSPMIEEAFRRVPGVVDVTLGHAGDAIERPFCAPMLTGSNGHFELVRVVFNPAVVSYETLLQILWAAHDSCQAGMQRNQPQTEGRIVVLYHDEGQRLAAETSIAALVHWQEWRAPASVEVLPVGRFRPARGHHRASYSRRSEEAE